MPTGRIQLGVIGRAHGVRGLVKVSSHTADPADLTAYGPLSDEAGRLLALRWKADGIAEVSRIVDGVAVKVTDRGDAEKLTNTRLFIDRSALPPADEEEFYLADLIGLAVMDQAGAAIGTVAVVHDYGAGASLEIERKGDASLLVPFTAACVPMVDIQGGRLVVAAPEEIVVRQDADGIVRQDADGIVRQDADGNTAPDADGDPRQKAGGNTAADARTVSPLHSRDATA
jgi:16S rRNA processing protein RimM